MNEKKKYVSLFICGHCGKEDKAHSKKVICHGYANILCYSCRCIFEESIRDLARKYLGS